MSLSYSVFNDLGLLIKYWNIYAVQTATLMGTDLAAIYAQFFSSGQLPAIEQIAAKYAAREQQATSFRQTLGSFALNRLVDPATMLDPLSVATSDITTVLNRLHEQMLLDVQTIKRSVATAGPVTAAAANAGNFRPLLTLTLDGVTSPGIVSTKALLATSHNRGLATELVVPADTILVRCVADQFVDQVNDGDERFAWNGDPAVGDSDVLTEGSGAIGTVSCMHGRTVLTNGDFETFASNTPTSWTIAGGTAGVNVFSEAVNIYHGASGLKLLGDASTASISVTQALTNAQVGASRRYCFVARIKAASVPGAGTLTMELEGTGYTAGAATYAVQTLQISGTPTGGTYTITLPFLGLTTAPIAYNAISSAVQTALRLLVGAEAVVVTTSAGSAPNITHQIVFNGIPGALVAITADITSLTGGSPAKAIAITTPGVEGEKVVLPPAGLPTAWMLAYFFVNMPATIPTDLKMVIKWTGTPSAIALYVDDCALSTVDYGAGLGMVVARGNVAANRDDLWTFPVANTEGVIQNFFRRVFGKQLPSSASPTISDSLAT